MPGRFLLVGLIQISPPRVNPLLTWHHPRIGQPRPVRVPLGAIGGRRREAFIIERMMPMDEAANQGTVEIDDHRLFHRMPVRWDAALDAGHKTNESDCLVLDISPGGAKIQTPDPLPADASVVLTPERGGRFHGKVAWQQGSYLGIAFDRTHEDFLAA